MSRAPARLVDARGMLCPWPALRLGRAAREMSGPGTVRILADDQAAPRELAALCAERGWTIDRDPADRTAFVVNIS